MHPRAVVTRVALCAAVVASVATSPAQWDLRQIQPVQMGTLSNQTPELHYMVHGELRGTGPYEGGVNGLLMISVSYQPQAWPAPDHATFHLRLVSLSHPEMPPIEQDATFETNAYGAGLASDYIDVDLLQDCKTGPCTEDYQLTISRDPAIDLQPMDVTGSIDFQVYGNTAKAPAGAELVLEVTPL